MDALGVALCYALAAILVALCVAFVILAERLNREENAKNEKNSLYLYLVPKKKYFYNLEWK